MTLTPDVVWIIAMLITGGPVALDLPPFDTESGCQLYLHTHVKPIIQEAFAVQCISIAVSSFDNTMPLLSHPPTE